MSNLNQTASGQRTHIAFFGLRNAGKSSVVNAITNQAISLVSDVKGTTTDPVTKAMEILPLGPVVIIDTPGLDDEGLLGELRVKRAKEVLKKTDIGVLVVDGVQGLQEQDKLIIQTFIEAKIPYLVVFNKSDLAQPKEGQIWVSALTKEGIDPLKEKLASLIQTQEERFIIKDLVNPGETIILVIPIDSSAPKGRIILPQQQVLRECLDLNAMAYVCQVDQLDQTIKNMKQAPKLVITDSQAFEAVSQIVPDKIALTSFSILMARYKGDLATNLAGANQLDHITDDSRILISEGCTHHRQCEDIGTVKLPNWIRNYTKANPQFEFTSGQGFKEDLSQFDLVIHCGGCMLNPKQVQSRINDCLQAGTPFTNYGLAIAKMHGILDRSIAALKEV